MKESAICLKTINFYILSLILGLFLLSHPAFASNGGFNQAGQSAGGFTGPGPALVSVEQAKTLRDDTHVTLQGYIIQSLGDEKYLFKDDTGTIKIEIDDDEWGGVNVKAQDKVEIQGEVDKGIGKLEIEVDRIKIL